MRSTARLQTRSLLVLPAILLLLTAPGICQGGPSSLVVPPGMAATEANGAESYAFAPFSARRQLILDASWLAAASGGSLTSVSLRRNQGTSDTNVGGLLVLEVAISHSPRGPRQASSTFSANRGPDHTVVFAGPISLPSAQAATTTPAPWTAPFAVQIPFLVPFPLVGGPICMETMTQPIPGPVLQNPWWPVDAVIADIQGSVQTMGSGCIPDVDDPSASAEEATLTVGATAVFYLRGNLRPGQVTCLIGTSNTSYGGVPLPFDLTVFGLPGCRLFNDVVISAPALATTWPLSPSSHASVDIPLPPWPALVGASLYTQWMVTTPARSTLPISLSNGVHAVLGQVPAGLDVAWVEGIGRTATTGRVLNDRCPVLRFTYIP